MILKQNIRAIIILTLLLGTWAELKSKDFFLKTVVVRCHLSGFCKKYQKRYENILFGKNGIKEIRRVIGESLLEGDIEKLSYEVLEKAGNHSVHISLKQKNKLKKINIFPKSLNKYSKSIFKIIPLKKGDFFDKRLLRTSIHQIKKIFREKGYKGNKVIPSLKVTKNFVVLDFKIVLGKLVTISDISLNLSKNEEKILLEDFQRWRGRRWDSVRFKIFLENLSKRYFSKGFYNFYVGIKKVQYSFSGRDVNLFLNITLGEKKSFYFKGNRYLNRSDIVSQVKNKIIRSKKVFGDKDLKKIIMALYEEKGIYNSSIKINSRQGRTKDNLQVRSFYCYIKVGKKIKLRNIEFIGNKYFKKKVLVDSFFKKGTSLIKNNYLDKRYLKDFKVILREKYYRDGFLFSEISDPEFTYRKDKNDSLITIHINEGQQVLLKNIILKNVPKRLKVNVLKLLKNKVGRPLNIVDIKEDLALLIKLVKERGFFFAKIKNLDLNSLVQYNDDYTSAVLFIDFDLKKKSLFESFLVTGNKKTKREVFAREFDFVKGDILTPRLILNLKERLSSLGLFSLINITPYTLEKKPSKDFYYVDLVIRVKEKDSIHLTLAPGYRTDIGVKLSTELKFSNFQRMNRSLIVKAQTNQRLDFSSLDNRRSMEKKRLLEFSLKTSFFEPYFLGRPFEFEGTVIASRKRQRSFDADFLKASLQITKTLIPKLSYSLKYQLEAIEQFDFSHSKDEGFVRIGSMKPSLSYDFRKNKISPREGGIFGISAEFASPIFFSMKGLGKEVNYLKLISRNRYYINWGKWVYAISLSLGFQKNLASDVLVDANGLSKKEADGSYQLKGFIPSIKVFNLNGVDSVRGYSPNEINKLDSGENIGDIIVRNSAYFSNLKLEPRYYFNDQFAFSLFIDGGRLFINSFKPLKMRFGAGIGVKVLTPVGSLDFDYGIKLKREEISGGHKEEFGRFHLSIGFF